MEHKEFVYGGLLNDRFEELSTYELHLVGVQEVRWEGTSRRVHIFLWKEERSP
jgi:hypothetical protein